MKYFNNKQQAYKRNKVLNRRDADNLIVASHAVLMIVVRMNRCINGRWRNMLSPW